MARLALVRAPIPGGSGMQMLWEQVGKDLFRRNFTTREYFVRQVLYSLIWSRKPGDPLVETIAVEREAKRLLQLGPDALYATAFWQKMTDQIHSESDLLSRDMGQLVSVITGIMDFNTLKVFRSPEPVVIPLLNRLLEDNGLPGLQLVGKKPVTAYEQWVLRV